MFQVLVRISQSEYLSLNDILIDLKLTPESLEMPVPRYFIEERSKEMEERDKLLVRTSVNASEALCEIHSLSCRLLWSVSILSKRLEIKLKQMKMVEHRQLLDHLLPQWRKKKRFELFKSTSVVVREGRNQKKQKRWGVKYQRIDRVFIAWKQNSRKGCRKESLSTAHTGSGAS